MTGQGGGPFQGIRAITLDLDDTLWPVLPVLAQAERELVEWLAPRAPLTAQTLAAGRSVLALKSQYPEYAHDMSWLRRRLLHDLLTELHEDPALADPAFAAGNGDHAHICPCLRLCGCERRRCLHGSRRLRPVDTCHLAQARCLICHVIPSTRVPPDAVPSPE